MPDRAQIAVFRQFQADYAAVCTYIALVAQRDKIKDRFGLHRAVYNDARRHCGTAAQVTVLAIKQVAGAYRTLGSLGRLAADKPWPTLSFSAQGSVPYDARTYRVVDNGFSLYTPQGRTIVRCKLGAYQRRYAKRGPAQESRLVCKRGKWFMHVGIRQDDPPLVTSSEVLGIDVGEVNIAATSSNKIFKANRLRHNRDRYLARRARLQRHGTQSAKQALCKVSGREARHVRHINHVVSKQLVLEGQRLGVGTVAMEDLTHMRDRIKAGKQMRGRLHRWPWRQLQSFVAYKAQERGLATAYVNPAYTSQTCSVCGQLGDRQGSCFKCSCGSLRHADANAACNIRKLA